MKKIALLVTITLLFPLLGVAAEIGTALKADNIRVEPYADAKTKGSFARGDRLEILRKQGAWLQVKTTKTTGWVRLLSVKRGTSSSGNQAKGVLDVASGRAGTGQVVATTGVRGLSEEELKSAKFNETEVNALEGYTQTTAQGQQFAGKGGLKPVKVAYLPASTAQGGAK
jgi:hypothetical protein